MISSSTKTAIYDNRILQYLREYAAHNGGHMAPVRTIARDLDIGPNVAHRRIKALRQAGHIQTTPADTRGWVTFYLKGGGDDNQ